MAGSKLKIRGQETTINFTFNGVLQAGSALDVMNFSHKPMIDFQQLPYLGEPTDQFDEQIHGHEFSFDVNEEDSVMLDNILMPLIAALKAGNPLPTTNVSVFTKYRDNSSTSTKIMMDCKIKVDDFSVPGRKEFNKITVSGRCRDIMSV